MLKMGINKLTIIFLIMLITASISLRVAKSQVKQEVPVDFHNIKIEKINPNSLIYPVKRIFERILLLFINRDLETNYRYNLLQKRLNELVFLVNNEKTGFYVEAVGRYNAEINTLRQRNDRRPSVYDNNIQTLEKLRDKYSANSSYWLIIQHAIDTTKYR